MGLWGRLIVNISLFITSWQSQNKKITSFNLIRLYLQKKIILEMLIPAPIEYFTVKSGQEMDLAPVTAMNFMSWKFFL